MTSSRSLLFIIAASAMFLLSVGSASAASVERTSAPVLHIDSDNGNPPFPLTAAYASYKVTNDDAMNYPDVWLVADSFQGGFISLAASEDGIVHLGPMSSAGGGSVKTGFIFLTTTGPTTEAQTHTISVLDGPPGVGTVIGTADFSLVASETIKANANKVETVLHLPDVPALGSEFTMTVTGATGTIGDEPDYGQVLSFTPAAAPAWPCQAFELVGSKITFSGGNTDVVTDALMYIAPNTPNSPYVAEYRFRIADLTVSTTPVSPVGYIASGTQVKHTATGADTYLELNPVPVTQNTLTLDLLPAYTNVSTGGGTVTQTFAVTNGSLDQTVTLDGLVDLIADSGQGAWTYVLGSTAVDGGLVEDPAVSADGLRWTEVLVIPPNTTVYVTFDVTYTGGDDTYTHMGSGLVGSAAGNFVVIDTTTDTTDDAPGIAVVIVGPPPANDPPEGGPDEVWVLTGTASVTSDVAATFTDDDNVLVDSVAITTQPTGAIATADTDGTIVVTPTDVDTATTYEVAFEICDDDPFNPQCADSTLTVVYNDPPTVTEDGHTLTIGGTLIQSISVLQAASSQGDVAPGWTASAAVSASEGGAYGDSVTSALGGTCAIVGGDVVYSAPAGATVGTDSCWVQLCEIKPAGACGVGEQTFNIVECITDGDCGSGSICDEATNTCITCLDDTNGGLDDGCTAGDPVCDDTTAGAETCLSCEDNADAGQTDNGCSAITPACDTTDAGAPVCVECLADGDCGSGAVCDEGTNTCITCLDDTDGGLDDGCTAGDPVCDDSTAGAEACLSCENSADAGQTDNGCSAITPACDTTDVADPVCVECLADGDCGSGAVCDEGTNTCITCLDDTDGGLDDGCSVADPVCDDTTAGAETCLTCEDNAGAGETDNGCTDATPLCDETGESPACVQCFVNDDCPNGSVCDAGTNTCIGCEDDTDGGQDAGCGEAAPACDDSTTGAEICQDCEDNLGEGETDNGCADDVPACDESGETPVCVECQVDVDCGSGRICDEASNTCIACIDDTDGGLDDGCGTEDPVCDDTTVGAETCVTCEDNMSSGDTDNGCDDGAPACDESGEAPVCVECIADGDCGEGTVCDAGSNTCIACIDNTDGGQDNGCDAADPVCDDTTVGAETCLTCEDNMGIGDTDNGCEAGAPACDESGEAPVCVECQADGDCAEGSVCDEATNTCTACIDDTDGGQDTGCAMADPVCDDTTVGAETCLTCEDNMGAGETDNGCAEDVPACEESGEAPVCVECLANDDCADGGVCDAATNTCVACVDDTDGGQDSGCDADSPVCDDSTTGAEACLVCEDNMGAGETDNGCDDATPACDESGETSVCVPCQVDADCGSGACEAGQCVDFAPGDDVVATPEDTEVLIAVLINDSDGDDGADALVLNGIIDAPAHGDVVVNVDGTVTYAPDANYNGVDSFTYEVCVGSQCRIAVVTIAVTPINDAPVGADDGATTPLDTAVTVDVLANDADPDDDAIAVTGVNVPGHGTVTINDDGTVTYTPNAGYVGEDSFSYSVCDELGACDTAMVSVDVGVDNAPPIAVDDVITLGEDSGPVAVDVLDNDSDPDGNPLSVVSVSQPLHGIATIDEDGAVVYAPEPNYEGFDSFTYTVCDDVGACETATVEVTIEGMNDAPVAVDDELTTEAGRATTIAVLDNDHDPDGDTLMVTDLDGAEGQVVIEEDGTLTFMAEDGFTGEATFSYTVCDPEGLCAEATVTVHVVAGGNEAPVAADDTYAVTPGAPVSLDVLENDTDPNGDDLAVSAVQQPAHGTVTISADGTLEYTPDDGYEGEDTFTYDVCDDRGLCDTASVTLNVDDGNSAPVAADDEVLTREDVPVIINAVGNDSDADGDDLGLPVVQDTPLHGVVTVNDDGTFTYTPDANYVGRDYFTYEVCDTNGLCATALVTVDVLPVNDAPYANDDTVTTGVDVPATVRPADNDSDPEGDELVILRVGEPANGTVTDNGDGSVTYTPDPGFSGQDAFTYTVCDPDGACSEAIVTVFVGGDNGPPDAQDDTATATEDGGGVVIDVTANDSDPDGDAFEVVGTTGPGHGTVVVNEDGTVTYTPETDFNGTDTFQYTVCDASGRCDTATVTVAVSPTDDGPVAVDDYRVTQPMTAVAIAVLDNDLHPDGDLLTVATVGAALHGEVIFGPDGGVTYTPEAGFLGLDQFNYTGCDSDGDCSLATVYVFVQAGENTVPVAEDDSYALEMDETRDLDVQVNDSDADGDALVITEIEQPESGTATLGPDGTITYTPEPGYEGEVTFVYEVCDPQRACDRAVVTIIVGDPNRGPTRLVVQGGACAGGGSGSGLPAVLVLALSGLFLLRRRRSMVL
jgi:Cys-rich repeat protein